MKKPEYQERFSIKIGDEIRFIQAKDVDWFHAEDKYVFLHSEQEQYLLDTTLKNLEETLDPQKFIRIHKSVIINCEKLNRIKRNFTGHYKIELNDPKKSSFEIGRTYLAKVRERLGF